MSQNEKKVLLNVVEYYDWMKAQKFKDSKEHYKYISYDEEEFLQNVIYPMFYNKDIEFKTLNPFPLVLKDYSSTKPIYVIDNNQFTIVFFLYNKGNDEICWEVSVQIKNHDFCDNRINEFKDWYDKHANKLLAEMEDMPEEYLYPKLELYDEKVEDFCIEFWNDGRDYMLFMLFYLLRLF